MNTSRQVASPKIGNTTRQTLEVLYELSGSDEPVGAAEIARRLNIGSSAAHRSLVTLKAAGLASRKEYSAKFTVGHMVHQLVMALLRRYPIRTEALPVLRKIVIELGEPLALYLRLGWYCIRVLSIESPRQDRPHQTLAEALPLHEISAGQVILASMRNQDIEDYSQFREQRDDSGRPCPASMKDRLASIAEKGFAVSDSRSDSHIVRLSVPLESPEGIVFGAIEVACPKDADFEEKAFELRSMLAEFEDLVRQRPDLLDVPFSFLKPYDIVLD